jgi:S-DNA-T family DNA segregation ATPase FtsK/SpoIIIE
LQLNNPDDYASVLGKTEGMLPDKIKGRGLFRLDKDSLLEFQVASLTEADPPYAFIREFSKKMAAQYAGQGAAGVPVLPEKVTERFLSSCAQRGNLSRVPIGVEKSTLAVSYYNFTASVVSLVLSVNQEWQDFTDALGALVAARCGVKTVILAPTGKALAGPGAENPQVFNDTDSCVNAVREVYETVLRRNNEYKDRLSDGGALPQYEPLFVMIQSMSLLKTMLERYKPAEEVQKEASDDTPLNRLHLAMAKCARAYNVHFVVAESLNSLTPLKVEDWYKAHMNGNNGIWVGNGISTQFHLTISKKPQEYSAELDSDFGFVIHNGAATLVKLLQ